MVSVAPVIPEVVVAVADPSSPARPADAEVAASHTETTV
jgi:hypothetical protein